MNYEGRVFRPPSEAYSLIIQATVGCSHNACRFCDMYKEKRFHIRPLEAILEDLREARSFYPSIHRIFLADGDALVMRQAHLITILKTISQLFPECERVACYASPKSLGTKDDDQLAELHSLGLTMAYMGLESGDDGVLTHVNKGASAADMITGGKRIRQAGIALSVTAISGLGGTAHWQDHAIHTAEALSAMNPDYIGLLTLRLEGQAPMVEEVAKRDFTMLTPIQVAAETRLLLSHMDSPGSVLRANHISNYVNLAGTLNADIPQLLATLDAALEGQIPFKSEAARYWDVR